MRLYLKLALLLFLSYSSYAQETSYDIVIKGGRVIDPETGLDAIRNVGIVNDRIIEISEDELNGASVIDATGLVVAPGFIDLHVHGMTNVEQEYQAHDGVTTALELEGGLAHLRPWYDSREGKALINYGASVSWGTSRFMAMQENARLDDDGVLASIFNNSVYEELPPEDISNMLEHIQKELQAGGIGIGVPIGYYPGSKPEEDFRLYQFAGEKQVPIFTHVRKGGTIAIQQAIANAMLTNAPLHIVHMNSMALGDIELGVEMVQRAQKQGYKISTEMYPYTAASTNLGSALFDDGWQESFDMSYEGLQWVATGERLTEETFQKYRKQGGTVIIHMMKPEWIAAGLKTEGTIVASDGMPYAKLAHPRTAGTFSRVLGKYVREDKILTLNEALAKMTVLPAEVLSDFVPGMKNKGRIQVGADADITIFNPDTIIDNATFEEGLAFSTGVQHVLVSGRLVIENGETVKESFPGKPIFGKFRR
jgi:dihydroorotase